MKSVPVDTDSVLKRLRIAVILGRDAASAARLLARRIAEPGLFLGQKSAFAEGDAFAAEERSMFLKGEKLLPLMSPDEQRLAATPWLERTPEDLALADLYFEEAAVAAWALGLLPELPPSPAAADPEPIYDALRAASFGAKKPRLRSFDAIARAASATDGLRATCFRKLLGEG